MVRKATSPSSVGSQKENTGVDAREQMKSMKDKAKSARRAAGRVGSDEAEQPEATQDYDEKLDEEVEQPKATQDYDEKLDEEDAEEDEQEEEGDGSPKGRKRVRVNTEGDARNIDLKGKAKAGPKTLPRDDDGYATFGSL